MRILIFIVLLSNVILAQETSISLSKKDSLNVKEVQYNEELRSIKFINSITNQKSLIQEESVKFIQYPQMQTYAPKSIHQSLPEKEESKNILRGPSQYDSRIEIFQLNKDSLWQNNIHIAQMSVGIVVDKKMLSKVSKDYYQLNINNTLGSLYNLCASVPFQNQPAVGVGTAFLIDKNRMITANHVFEKNIEHYAIVFDFFMSSENGIINPLIKKENIYFPDKILKKKMELDVVV